ncbi:unnamed protein product [Discosporangium mesarthrocarpum]
MNQLLQTTFMVVRVAMEDCWEGSKNTLSQTKRLLLVMSDKRLRKAFKKCHLSRLRGLIEEVDHLLVGLQYSAQGDLLHGNSAGEMEEEGEERQEDGGLKERVATIPGLLEPWRVEDHDRMNAHSVEVFASMLPSQNHLDAMESIRKWVEKSVRTRWKSARVELFGSSAGQLSMPTSDVDLSMTVPSLAQVMHKKRVILEEKKKKMEEAEDRNIAVVSFMTMKDILCKKSVKRPSG